MSLTTPREMTLPPQEAMQGVTLAELVAILRRHLLALLVFPLVGLLAGALMIGFQVPLYEAEALLVVRGTNLQQQRASLDATRGEPGAAAVRSQAELISTAPVLEPVVERLGLMNDPEFNPLLAEDRADAALTEVLRDWALLLESLLQRKLGLSLLDWLEEERTVLDEEATRRLVVASARGAITAMPKGDSFVVSVTASSRDPQRAADLANATAETFVELRGAATDRHLRSVNSWLDERLKELRTASAQADETLESFRNEAGLFQGSSSPIKTEQLSQVTSQLQELRAETTALEARLAEARRLARGEQVDRTSDVLDSSLIQSLRLEEARSAAELGELMATLGPRHPRVQTLEGQLSSTRQAIAIEVEKIIASLRERVTTANSRERLLERTRSDLEAAIAREGGNLAQLAQLEQRAMAAREALHTFELEAARLAEAGRIDQPTIELAAAAAVPLSPSWPPKKAILLLSAIAGLCLALLCLLFRETLDAGFRNERQVARQLGLPTLAVLPAVSGALFERRPHRLLESQPSGAFAQAVRRLYVNLDLGRATSELAPAVLVTSALSGEGKTETVLALAGLSAKLGRRTLLLDLDLHKQAASRAVQAKQRTARNGQDPGLEADDSFGGPPALVEELLLQRDGDNLFVLAARQLGVDPLRFLQSPQLDALVQDLRGRFDLVVIDAPPLLSVADTRVIARLADRVLLAVRWARTRRHQVEAAAQQLRSADTTLAGVVFTQADLRRLAKYGAYEAAAYESSSGYYVKDVRRG